MRERVVITYAKGERKELEREYFTMVKSELETPHDWAAFIGGYHKHTLRGIGRNRNYNQYVEGEIEVVATTQNQCRSGRYGNWASFIIATHPLDVQERGVA